MCDYPGCERHFVRLDLCNRHRDRHTAKGSSLNRKDPLPGQSSPAPQEPRTPFVGAAGSASPESLRPRRPAAAAGHKIQTSGGPLDLSPSAFNNKMPFSPISGTPTGVYSNGFSSAPGGGEYTHAHGPQDHQNSMYGNHAGQTPSTLQRLRPPYQSPAMPQQSAAQTNDIYDVMSPTIPHPQSAGGFHNNSHPAATPQTSVFVATQNFPAFDLPPSNFVPTSAANNTTSALPGSAPHTPTTVTRDPMSAAGVASSTVDSTTGYSAAHGDYDVMPTQSGSEMMMLDQMSIPNTMPMFGPDMLQKSPHVGLPEDFMVYLFNNTPVEGSPMVNYQK